jgi:hypothetical protein
MSDGDGGSALNLESIDALQIKSTEYILNRSTKQM